MKKAMVNSMFLTDREWKEFYIGGNSGIFNLKSTSSGIDKNKLNSSSGDIPYITRTDKNNGIDMFVCDAQNQKYNSDRENAVSIGLDTQTVFYQSYNFYTGQNIQVLTNEHLNKYNAQFICRLLKLQLQKFNWGGNGATLGRLVRTKIMLPVNDKNEPDYDFMEAFVKEQERTKKQEYIDYAKKVISILAYKEVEPLDNKVWKAFYVLHLFDYLRGNQNKMNSLDIGDRMLISAKNIDNGLKGFCKNNDKLIYKGHCLSLNNDGDGGVGLSYYQPYEFLLDSHVYALYSKEVISKYAYLFISQALSKQRLCFSHGRSISKSRLEKMKFMLPVNESENPDYNFMEQYMKNIMLKKYSDYLKYVGA